MLAAGAQDIRDRSDPLSGNAGSGTEAALHREKLWITLDRPENLVTILNGRTRLLPVGGVKTLIVTPRGIRPAV